MSPFFLAPNDDSKKISRHSPWICSHSKCCGEVRKNTSRFIKDGARPHRTAELFSVNISILELSFKHRYYLRCLKIFTFHLLFNLSKSQNQLWEFTLVKPSFLTVILGFHSVTHTYIVHRLPKSIVSSVETQVTPRIYLKTDLAYLSLKTLVNIIYKLHIHLHNFLRYTYSWNF